MTSKSIYDGPLYETIGESKPCFNSLPMLTRAPESCYVEIAGVQLLASSPDMEAPLLGGGSAEKMPSNGAVANFYADEDVKSAKPESFVRQSQNHFYPWPSVFEWETCINN